MGNGMLRVNFSYNNPNDEEVTVANGLSKLVIQRGKKRTTSFALNVFQPGEVENAFFVDFYEMEFVEWTVKNPGGKTKKSRASSNSPLCPDPPVIIPVYGQQGGKSGTPLGLELTSLAEGNAGDEPSKIIYQINAQEEVLIEIVPATGQMQNVLNILSNAYGRSYDQDPMNTDFVVDPQRIVSEGFATIDVFFPINQLLSLNAEPNINFIRPLYTPIRLEGIVTSQGDVAMLTDAVREAFVVGREEDGTPIKVDGRGVKIGVISDSFDKQPFSAGQPSRAAVDVQNGDLPGTDNPNGYLTPVDVIKDFPYGVASDEGRAMLQIVHDIAPGAELAFSTGVLSPRDFALAIQDLAAAGCDIITDDITYPFEPFFGEGQISDAIREFTSGEGSEGNAYFTSAGNFSDRGYQSLFVPSSGPPQTNIPALADATAHVFGTNPDSSEDVLQQINVVPGTYMIVLQWAEGLASQNNNTGATTDLDIFLVDDDGNLIVGNNRINTNGDAAEVLVFQATGTGTANILITRSSASGPLTGPLPMRYIAFRTSSDAGTADGLQFLEYDQGAPTVSGHAMTPEAITVGAIDYRVALNPSAQDFSSYAGILENNQLLEVDISAPDGGNTNVGSIGQDIASDEDSFPNFFGTSAAAPHAAAAFALLKSAISAWYPEGGLPVETSVISNLLADQLLQVFKTTSVPAGLQENAGIGLINAQAAFQLLASQTAVLTGLAVEEGKIPSQDTFEVTINGRYFPTSEPPTVIFDNQELEVMEGNTDTEIKAIVGPFAGNPELFVLTNGKTPQGIDGGLSNGLTFFSDGKIALNIIAEDIEIEFGDAYEFTFRVEGLPEPYSGGIPEGETLNSVLADLGLPLLPEIEVNSTATGPFPDVNSYVISPNFVEVVSQEQKDAYQLNLINGVQRVIKRDLIIKPFDASITYGEAILPILDYQYNSEGIENNGDFLSAIQSAHAQDFFEDNVLALINRARALVNTEILDLLNSGSWMATENTINNRARALVNELSVVDLDLQVFENYLTNRARALVNEETGAFSAVVNGEDLLSGNVTFNNRARALVNDSGLGSDDDGNEYGSVFAILDLTDDDEDGGSVDKFFSLNLISGIEVTIGDEDRHYIYPGAFLAPIAANFNITYDSARLGVEPAILQVQTPDLEIEFGTEISNAIIDDLLSVCDCPGVSIEGFVYDEDTQSVFPQGFLYILEDTTNPESQFILGEEEGQIISAGQYFIKIAGPQNYTLDFGEVLGVLTIVKKELIVSGNNDGAPLEVVYGNALSSEVLDQFVLISGLEEGEITEVFPDGVIPYFLESVGEEPETFQIDDLIGTGEYFVRIEMPASNYELIYVDPLLIRVLPAELLVEIQQSGPVAYGENTAGIPFNIFINGFVGEDTQSDIFPDGVVPDYFEAVSEEVPEGEERTRIEPGDPIEAGEYFIRVDRPQNYSIFYGEGHGTLTVEKAALNVCIADIEIRDGERLFPEDIALQGITGFVYEDSLESVFPDGITYEVNGEILTEEGLLLPEGTYSISINDEGLMNYVLVDGTTCSGTGKVNVTPCGDAAVLTFDSFQLVSGTDKQQEAVYRYSQVSPGIDALVTIVEKTGAHITQFDRNNSDNREDFKPEIRFEQNNGGPEPFARFRFEFVESGSDNPVNIQNLVLGLLDIDGTNQYQEFNAITLPDGYTVNDPKRIQDPFMSGINGDLLRINGSDTSDGGVSNSNPKINVEVQFASATGFDFIFGARCDSDGYFNTGSSRLAAIQFSCLNNFANPVTTVLSGTGTQGGFPEDAGVVYPNPVSSILFVETESISLGRVEIRDLVWGHVLLSQNFDSFSSSPLELDLTGLPAGLYALRIIGEGRILEYKIFKE
ncbi:S8 family serine peptidase [Muriicola jejuensis]|uniref:S8 family serine peptidase n=1 Tax=Muriicola jejuensis TaxID=504488 RepID=A0A6P0U8T3_9FLAO|nr:S8 family serine peptidase [Muriicola jejuensis]NER08980.1 S8 family serine peptidase [Muriicola jejuensis]